MDTAIIPYKTEINGKTRYKFPKKEVLEEATKEYAPIIKKANKQLEKEGLPFGSPYNMQLVLMQVAARFPTHLDEAIPYLTVKTFSAWKKDGRKVTKGEKAMQIVVWMNPSKKDKTTGKYEVDEDTTYPKTTHVFGVWQTEPIKK